MKHSIFILFFTAFILISCEETVDPYEQIYTKEAVIEWHGDYEADGCGFFIKMDTLVYKPENENTISNMYKTYDDVEVVLMYKYLKEDIEYYCGDFPGVKTTPAIKIISITNP